VSARPARQRVQPRNRRRENCTSGTVRGAPGNRRSYRRGFLLERLMHIYIDESGSFVLSHEQRSSLSCVAALIVSESEHDALLSGFETLAGAWGYSFSEIKGRNLNESQFAEVIKLLCEFKHTFLRLAAIDVGLHSESVVTNHKKRQAREMRNRMGSQFHPALVSQVYELAARIEETSNQLYVEFVLLTQLVTSVIQTSTLYYSQSEPGSLSRFRWRIDAKAESSTDYEQMWRLLVTPFTQSQSLRRLALFLRGGDYSAFSRFQNPDLPRVFQEHRNTCHKRCRTQWRRSARLISVE
jgi:hypothetical protein